MGLKSYFEKKAYENIREIRSFNLKSNEIDNKIWHNLCIIYPAYVENRKTDLIETILHQYDLFDKEVLNHLEIVLIDDCSPDIETLIDISKYKVNISLLRILDNIKWNSGGAKNLGVIYSSSERIIITDIDHFFPEDTCIWAMHTELNDREACYFKRIYQTGDSEKPHVNTFLMTRNTYFQLHGYDEDFCGMYGDDIFFQAYMHRNLDQIYLSPKKCITYDINVETHSLSRKVSLKIYIIIWFKKYRHSQKCLRFRWKYIGTNKGILPP